MGGALSYTTWDKEFAVRLLSLLLLLIPSTPVFACTCKYDPLVRLGQCLDDSETFLGNAKADDKGDLSEDPWFAKKVLNDAKCHKLAEDILKDKGHKTECTYVKEELKHVCKLVEPKKEED